MKKLLPRVLITLLIVGAILLGIAACSLTRAGYETAAYQVETEDSGFEIRSYPELVLVQTPMSNRNGRDGSFMRLFGYIQGDNEADAKIAMTTPVFMTEGEGLVLLS